MELLASKFKLLERGKAETFSVVPFGRSLPMEISDELHACRIKLTRSDYKHSYIDDNQLESPFTY